MTSAEPARLVPLGPPVLAALLDGDLVRAGALAGVALPEFFLAERWLWALRLRQVERDPAAAAWIVRAGVVHGEVVGHAGCHGRPDDEGRVEVGYTVLPELRGRGHGRALLSALLCAAEQAPEVRVVRACVSPDNAPSLALVRGAGFQQVGEEHDDEGGLELVFEREVR